MGIERFIAKVCAQTAVYWGNPTPDGYGGMTFDDAVEITCRWDEKLEVFSDNKGREVISKAVVLVTQDVDEEGYLYLGTTNDLDSDELVDPLLVQGAWMIRRFDKSPMIRSTTVFVRTAYL